MVGLAGVLEAPSATTTPPNAGCAHQFHFTLPRAQAYLRGLAVRPRSLGACYRPVRRDQRVDGLTPGAEICAGPPGTRCAWA